MIRIAGESTQRAIEAKLREIEALASELGHRYQVTLRLPQPIALRLGVLDDGRRHQPARPLWAMSRAMQDRVRAAITIASATGMGQRAPSILVRLQAGAQAVREVWVERLAGGGADLGPWAPLAPSTLRRKRQRGQPARPGIASGEALRALRSALVIVSRDT